MITIPYGRIAFIARLKSLGIPVAGVRGDGRACQIDYEGTPSAGQVTQANSEKASFDWAGAVTAAQAAEASKITDTSDLRSAATAALAQIETDLTTLGGSPTNAQVVAIVTRTVQRQRAIIKALRWIA